MYSPTLLDHFDHPRNSGDLPEATVRVRVENPVCADVLELALVVKDGKIDEIRFKAKGCVPSVACASLLTEMLKGRSLHDALVTAERIDAEVGGLPEASTHAAQLAVDAVQAARREVLRIQAGGAK
jgi:nitrogen fixation NifU-like protein